MTDEEIKLLQEEVANLKKERETLTGNVTSLQQQVNSVTQNLNQAVTGYRTLAVKAYPEAPAELIVGETIEAINEAVKIAGIVVHKVREKIEASRAQVRVPPGSPLRNAPDLSGLTAREKIQHGISQTK